MLPTCSTSQTSNSSIDQDDRTVISPRDRQLRILFETVLDAIVLADDRGHYLDVNCAACELFGLDKKELLKHCIADFVAPEFNFLQLWQEFTQLEKVRGEMRLVRSDGEIRVVEYAATANFFPHQHLSVMRDITKSKEAEVQIRELKELKEKLAQSQAQLQEIAKAEIALQASNSRWQLAIESAGDGTWDWNLQTNEIIFSRQWKAMLGYAEDEIINALEEWDSRCHPDDKFKCYEEVAKHLNGKTPAYHHEHRLRCKDGSYKWILARGWVVEWNQYGEPLRFIGTHSDISDRKVTELELEQFFSLALDLLCIADFSGRFRRLNRAWETTLGYSISELEGQLFLDLVHPDDIPVTLAVMSDLSEQKSITQFTNRYRAKDGTYRYIEWRSTPCGNVIYAAARDITEHKLTEAKLNEISERLSLALKSGAIGCWEWNIVQNTLLWDDRMYELYGVTKDSDTRLVYDIWATGLHPDDRDASETLIQQTVLGKAEFDPEFRVIHPDGSIHFIKAFGLVLRDAEGNPQKMIGVNFDISDRKRQEQALRLIVEGTAAKTGAEFFQSCVQYIAQVLEVRYAIITEYIDAEQSSAKTLAFWAG
ncbi:MAG: PAS domain-containing protein, partial [Phormidium sp.]